MKKSKFKEKINNFMQSGYRFMYGRYGTDELYLFGCILSLVLIVANFVIQLAVPASPVKTVIGACLLPIYVGLFAWMTFRSLSKNIYKRRRENARFLAVVGWLKRFFTFNTSTKTKSHNADSETHIFRDCTKCSATLRLPRKKGRNKVKCPKCGHRFYVISK